MSRKFIATIIAASIAVTGFSAAPARADGDDLARFLVGATALVIIGSAINDSRRDRRHRDVYVGRDHRDWRPERPRRHRRAALPSTCLRVLNTDNGRVRMMARRCLERNYRQASSLPNSCKIRVRADRKIRKGYKMRCLRDHGYRIAGR